MIYEPKSIIVSRIAGIGDVIMLTPLLQAIKYVIPHVELNVVTKSLALPLTSRMPFIDKAYGFEKDLKNEVGLLRNLFRKDLVFCVDESYRITFLYYIALIKNIVGLPGKREMYLDRTISYEAWMNNTYEPMVWSSIFENLTGIEVKDISSSYKMYYPEANAMEKAHVERTFENMGGTMRGILFVA